MLGLLLDIKCHIASFDETTWYLMYRYDPEFAIYARSDVGIRLYKKKFNNMTITESNDQEWRLCGKLHRECDENGESQPALICDNGTIEYYFGGMRHRNGDNPAVLCLNDTLFYFRNGKLHRDCDVDGNAQPAIMHNNFNYELEEYYQNGLLHRDDDRDGNPQPASIQPNSCKYCFKNGVMQELDGFDYWIKGRRYEFFGEYHRYYMR